MTKIEAEITKSKKSYVDFRHDLHKYPELGFSEDRTSKLIVNKLKSWGYDVHYGMAKTGIVGTLKVGNGNKTIGLRADMDALPMEELSGKDWASVHDNCFHGCGHDGHSTILLCAAEYLAKHKCFDGTLHVIFQPAEELLYGGKVMLDDGLFEQFPCDAIFSLHNMPGYEKGKFFFKSGSLMASADTVHIKVKGTGGHGAIPEKTIDATLVACHIGVALQSIVSRNVTPFEPAVITIGSIGSGQAANIVNEHALLKLSVRTLNPDVRAMVLANIEKIAQLQAESFGASANIEHIHGSPVLINGEKATEFAKNIAIKYLGEDKVGTALATTGSEDFAFMLEQNPNGCYLLVGAGEDVPMVHNPKYDFEDDLIVPAATYWCHIVENYLNVNCSFK